MRRSILLLFSLVVGTPALGAAQQDDSGAFVTRLGLDTLAVESFVRTKDRIEGTRVSRTPTTSSIHYVATLGRGGRVTRFEAELRRGGGREGTPTWTSITEFGAQEVVTTFTGSEGTRTIRQPAQGEVVPLLTNCFALLEQAVRQAQRAGGDQVRVQYMYPGQPDLTPTVIRRLGHDSVAIGSYHGANTFVQMDKDGRLLTYDATATVVKTTATRVAPLDLTTLARNFAAADSAGHAVGPVSLRDTARVVLGGARLSIDYGRPSKRGRTIYGGLVPWGEVWRTGADAATQLFVDRAITIGEFKFAPGKYSLWTIPTPEGATLVVNSQSGQWGTEHNGSADIARVPMTVAPLDHAVERFTIEFTPAAMGSAELHLRWDTTDWSVPVRLQ